MSVYFVRRNGLSIIIISSIIYYHVKGLAVKVS